VEPTSLAFLLNRKATKPRIETRATTEIAPLVFEIPFHLLQRS
jgi:hypothetical protein